jgi:NADPH-dependent curcumin reductase CurA
MDRAAQTRKEIVSLPLVASRAEAAIQLAKAAGARVIAAASTDEKCVQHPSSDYPTARGRRQRPSFKGLDQRA